jgi:hypothetical protein
MNERVGAKHPSALAMLRAGILRDAQWCVWAKRSITGLARQRRSTVILSLSKDTFGERPGLSATSSRCREFAVCTQRARDFSTSLEMTERGHRNGTRKPEQSTQNDRKIANAEIGDVSLSLAFLGAAGKQAHGKTSCMPTSPSAHSG